MELPSEKTQLCSVGTTSSTLVAEAGQLGKSWFGLLSLHNQTENKRKDS